MSPVYREHTLVGRIWDPGAARFVDAQHVYERARQARYVLLGEKHDNVDHHRLQARVLEAVMADGRRPDVVLEMISVDHQEKLAAYLAEHPGDAAGVGEAVGWSKAGWPAWDTYYRPIGEVAVAGGAPLVAGNLPVEAARSMRIHRFSPRADARPELGLDGPVPDDVREVLMKDLLEAHCGMAPGPVLPMLVELQHARDVQLARVMTRAGPDGAVLIAGAGHVRRSIAAPRFLDGDSLVVAFREVRADETDPTLYGDAADYDVIWFTPRVDDIDPCDRFREKLKDRFKNYEPETH